MRSRPQQSDVLVLFGATGDLAHRKIFPAIFARYERGHELPVIGVAADSGVETYAAMELHLDSRRWEGVPSDPTSASRKRIYSAVVTCNRRHQSG